MESEQISNKLASIEAKQNELLKILTTISHCLMRLATEAKELTQKQMQEVQTPGKRKHTHV
jgi:hypothetical protein